MHHTALRDNTVGHKGEVHGDSAGGLCDGGGLIGEHVSVEGVDVGRRRLEEDVC